MAGGDVRKVTGRRQRQSGSFAYDSERAGKLADTFFGQDGEAPSGELDASIATSILTHKDA